MARDRAVAHRVEQGLPVVARPGAAGSSSGSESSERTASSVRTRWCGVASPVARTPAASAALKLVDRLARREVEQVDRLLLVARRARGRGRPSRSRRPTGSRRSRARPRPRPRASGRRAESVGSSQWTATRRPVIAWYWSARRISPGATTGRPSSEKPAAPASASSAISVSSSPCWPFVIAARNPTGTSASVARRLDQRAEHRGRVDDRLGVRHRQDRAVAAGRRGGGAATRSSPRPRGPACAGARAGRRTPARARARAPRRPGVRSRRRSGRSARSRRRRRGRRAARRSLARGRSPARCGRRGRRWPSLPKSITPPPRRPARLDLDRARA